jgi:hypothetical protein
MFFIELLDELRLFIDIKVIFSDFFLSVCRLPALIHSLDFNEKSDNHSSTRRVISVFGTGRQGFGP